MSDVLFQYLLPFVARLHPIFVHFPIALVFAAVVAEVLAFRRARLESRTSPFSATPDPVAFFCLSFAALSCVVAGSSGWLLAGIEEFHGDAAETLFIHRWGGVTLTSFVLLCWLCARWTSRRHSGGKIYRALLAVCMLVTGLVGHTGGTLVHGDDLFSFAALDREDARASLADRESSAAGTIEAAPDGVVPAALNQKVDYDTHIHPIIQNSCAKCHLGGKAKGGFRMDTRDELLRGGETGAAISPGNGAKSHLVELVSGLDPDKIMPNKGRRLTTQEIALIRTWVDQGAIWGTSATDAYQRSEKPVLGLNRSHVIEVSAETPQTNPVDRVLAPYFRKNALELPKLIDDRTFMRRVSLDLVGHYPSFEQIEEFVASSEPDKRVTLVRDLLARDLDYAINWISFWNDLLRNDYTGAGYVDRGRKDITSWLFSALLQNYSYTRMVKELVNPSEASSGFVKGIVWRGAVNPNERPEMQAAQNIAQAFMAVNLKCTSCHDSFVDQWKLDDAYGMANIFAKEPIESHRCDVPTGQTAQPKFFFPELGKIDETLPREKRMQQLASVLTSKDNGLLPKAITNRIWAQLMGAGIVASLDDASGTAWSPELLETLAFELQSNDFDLKHLLTVIVTSSIYQREFLNESPPPSDAKNVTVFKGGFERRMKSEQFEDTLREVFAAPESGTKKEWIRWLSLLNDAKFPAPYTPKAHTTAISSAAPSATIDIDITGAKTLWLVAVPEGIPLLSRRIPKTPLLWRAPTLLSASGSGKGKPGDTTLLSRLQPLAVGDGATLVLDPTAPKKELTFLGKPESEAIAARSPSVLAYSLKGLNAKRFQAEVGFQATADSIKGARSFRFLVFTDLSLPASIQDRSSFATALGRLARDNIVSERPSTLTTLDALELTNGEEFHALLKQAALSMVVPGKPASNIVDDLWKALLLREPTPEEATQAKAFLVANSTQSVQPAKLEDLLWSMVLLPEFQLVR